MLKPRQINLHNAYFDQLSDSILMVTPSSFKFNPQTASDNHLQNHLSQTTNHNENVTCSSSCGSDTDESEQERVYTNALKEFKKTVMILRSNGVKVHVLNKTEKVQTECPCAVFCNNWITTHRDGTICIYPMKAPNRRLETKRIHEVHKKFIENGFKVKNILHIGHINGKDHFLEGTGSMCIDHLKKIIYAAQSERTSLIQLQNFVDTVPFYERAVVFNTRNSLGKPFSHTDVILSIGDKFVVLCKEAIVDDELNSKENVYNELKKTGREIIEISLEQAEKYFCGNIMQLKSSYDGKRIIAMSTGAYKGFTENQLKRLGKYGKIVALPISNTIEYIGGGSIRCLICEIFLPFMETTNSFSDFTLTQSNG